MNCDVKETIVLFQICSSLEIHVQEIEQIFGDGSNFSSYLEPYLGPIHLESQLVLWLLFFYCIFFFFIPTIKFQVADCWLGSQVRLSFLLTDLEKGRPAANILVHKMPHIIPHKVRYGTFSYLAVAPLVLWGPMQVLFADLGLSRTTIFLKSF